MRTIKTLLAVAALTITASAGAQTLKMNHQVVRVTAYEASTSVNLVVVKPEKQLDALDPSAFAVQTNGIDRKVKIAYTCDDRGEWADGGEYLALGLEVSNDRKAAPLVSLSMMGTWSTAYPISIKLQKGKSIKAGGKKYTAVECETEHALRNFVSEADYFSRGTFTGPSTGRPGDETLTYGAYEPSALRFDGKQNPLIIWLHGMGEGGTDVSIELLGNEVVALIRNDIQQHFTTEGGENGAYVLAVQCPVAWMVSAHGFGSGNYPSLYADALKSCIDNYVTNLNSDIDRNRIYIGGCSNGGFMTMHMLLRNPGYFAAAYPTCEAFADVNISNVQLKQLSEENIWFVQSFDDTTVKPTEYCIPTYKRLMEAGAKNVWISMFENVTGSDFGQRLFGHFSWCYVFNDEVTGAQEQSTADMVPSNNGGGTVAPQGHANLFEWMNAQVLKAPEMQPMFGGSHPKEGDKKGNGRFDENGNARF